MTVAWVGILVLVGVILGVLAFLRLLLRRPLTVLAMVICVPIAILIGLIGLFSVRSHVVVSNGYSHRMMSGGSSQLHDTRRAACRAIVADMLPHLADTPPDIDWAPGRPFVLVANPLTEMDAAARAEWETAILGTLHTAYPQAGDGDLRVSWERRNTAGSREWNGEGLNDGEAVLELRERRTNSREMQVVARLLTKKNRSQFCMTNTYRYADASGMIPAELPPSEVGPEQTRAADLRHFDDLNAVAEQEARDEAVFKEVMTGPEAETTATQPAAVETPVRKKPPLLTSSKPAVRTPTMESPQARLSEFPVRLSYLLYGSLPLMLFFAYLFHRARTAGAWAWPMRIVSALAFVALCILLLRLQVGMMRM